MGNILNPPLTSDNDLSKTDESMDIAIRMTEGLQAKSDDMAEHFHEDFDWIANTGCGIKHGIDEFSSARVFDGWREEVEGAVRVVRNAVVVAKAFLLTKGWRRHRRLSVWEQPAHE